MTGHDREREREVPLYTVTVLGSCEFFCLSPKQPTSLTGGLVDNEGMHHIVIYVRILPY